MFKPNIQNTTRPKLKIGSHNDKYEIEADSVADKVMQIQQNKTPNIQRKCEACEEEELQMKPVENFIPPIIQKKEEEEEMLQMKGLNTPSSTNLNTALQKSKSTGQILPKSTATFMSNRIGADFSNVKIHTNEKAVQMNQQLNAKAFTNGNDVYFNKGQYSPQSSEGKHLLAHELTHVVQQKGFKKAIQRKPIDFDTSTASLHKNIGTEYSQETGVPFEEGIQYSQGYQEWLNANTPSNQWLPPVEVQVNPLERLKQNKSTAKTFLVINGKEVDGMDMSTLITNILTQITPTAIRSESVGGGQVKCRFDPTFKLNAGSKIIIPTPPSNNGWKAKLPSSALNNPAVCAGKTNIPTVLHGKPDHNTHYKLVRDSEFEHEAALKELYNRHLVPYYQYAMNLSVTGASEADCKIQLNQQLGLRPKQAAFGFVLGDAAETRRFDAPGSTHHGNMTIVDLGTNCNKVTMESTQNNPQQPRNAPGNIRKIAPTIQVVDPAKLTVNGNDLLSDGNLIKTFSSSSNALSALGMMMVHKITEIRSIGPFQIALSNGAAPILKVNGITELKFDPNLIQVSIGLPNAADWVISQVSGDQFFEITNFGSKRNQAYSAVEIMQQFGFTHKIWIGSANAPDFSYFLKM